jgi:hypothetical protein
MILTLIWNVLTHNIDTIACGPVYPSVDFSLQVSSKSPLNITPNPISDIQALGTLGKLLSLVVAGNQNILTTFVIPTPTLSAPTNSKVWERGVFPNNFLAAHENFEILWNSHLILPEAPKGSAGTLIGSIQQKNRKIIAIKFC